MRPGREAPGVDGRADPGLRRRCRARHARESLSERAAGARDAPERPGRVLADGARRRADGRHQCPGAAGHGSRGEGTGSRGDRRRRSEPRPRDGPGTGGSALRPGLRPGEHPSVAGGADARQANDDRHRVVRDDRSCRNARPDPRSRFPSCAIASLRQPVGAGDLARRVRRRRLVAQPLLARRRTVRGPEPRPGAGHGEPRRAAATGGVRTPESHAQPGPAAAVRDEPADNPLRGQSRSLRAGPN